MSAVKRVVRIVELTENRKIRRVLLLSKKLHESNMKMTKDELKTLCKKTGWPTSVGEFRRVYNILSSKALEFGSVMPKFEQLYEYHVGFQSADFDFGLTADIFDDRIK